MTETSAQSGAAVLYAFERGDGPTGHRDPDKARQRLRIFWRRLGGDEVELDALETQDPEGHLLLVRFATDCPLSIEWYEDRRPRLEHNQRRYDTFVIVLAALLFLLAFLLPFQPLLLSLINRGLEMPQPAQSMGLIDVAALLGVVSTGVTVALRLSSQVVRYRSQGAVFHRASASLKELLYRLEGDWRGRALCLSQDDARRLAPEFRTAVRRGITEAQAILSEERNQYFQTMMVDVSALADTSQASTSALLTQTISGDSLRKEQAQRRRTIEERLAQARLGLARIEARLEVAAGSPDLEHKRPDLEMQRQEQRAEVRHFEAMLREYHG